jgi:hypothetical protein
MASSTIVNDFFLSFVCVSILNDFVVNKFSAENTKNYPTPFFGVGFSATIVNNQLIIQGLISLEVKSDNVYMHLVESAPFNKGKTKIYSGVPGNLVAFACKLSFQRGHEGNVSFISKTQLIDHYIESLGAIHVGGRLMIIDSKAAAKLINRYFSNI